MAAVGRKMPGSVTSVFSEPSDFEAALRQDGVLGMLITGRGQFRARLTQITLHHMHLAAGEEELSRIAFIPQPPFTGACSEEAARRRTAPITVAAAVWATGARPY
jgi:hypothetical protein